MKILERTKYPAKNPSKIRWEYYIYNELNNLQRSGCISGGILGGNINRANTPK